MALYLIYYYIFLRNLSLNILFFIIPFILLILSIYYLFKSELIKKKNLPCIIFDNSKITSCSIIRKYSLDITLFAGYKFVTLDGRNYINIYPKNYKKFTSKLRFHPLRRFTFSTIKSRGYEGLMINLFTLSTNYAAALDYLNKAFNID